MYFAQTYYFGSIFEIIIMWYLKVYNKKYVRFPQENINFVLILHLALWRKQKHGHSPIMYETYIT